MKAPSFVLTADDSTNRNFQALTKTFTQMFRGASATEPASVNLATGDNSITPGVSNPAGRLITFQSAAANLFDKGLINGKWVINASAPCTIKITFF